MKEVLVWFCIGFTILHFLPWLYPLVVVFGIFWLIIASLSVLSTVLGLALCVFLILFVLGYVPHAVFFF